MSRYAENTSVSVDATRAEIERTLRRYGAKEVVHAYTDDRAVVMFSAHGRQVRFILPFPSANDRSITHTPTGLKRSSSKVKEEHAKAIRSSWRSLLLVIKAKLEAVETGVVAFEREFLAYTVLPDNQTVGDHVLVGVTQALTSGVVPELLPH